MHSPGLKVVMPATPADAKGLLKTAIRDDDPVIFLEHRLLYATKGEVPAGEYTVPLGKAAVSRKGNDVTVVATAMMVHKALEAAGQLEKEGGEVEVLEWRAEGDPLARRGFQDAGRKVVPPHLVAASFHVPTALHIAKRNPKKRV